MGLTQTALTQMTLQQLESEHPGGPLTFALLRADPDYEPSGEILVEMTKLGLADNGKVKADVRAMI